ncbi:MAG: hypothetical protein AAFO04_24120 [Cyanobacteria bacterium J06592_8]
MLDLVQTSDFGFAVAPTDGSFSGLDATNVHKTSADNAITPDNPGSWESFRYAPVIDEARTFTEEEAQALTDFADEAQKMTPATRKAYRAAKKLTKLSTEVNEAHEDYRRIEGGEEHKKQRCKNESAKYLHGLRPKYARLGKGLENADKKAEATISRLMGVSA